ncbi:hypothetical protein SASPL_149763 [Salvia splendens]|uniref:Amino acid transporter transmembrane domain-containing protein n=1 Tax=Salvia splendens TaxID=180675 RepID=A0A8X8W5I9_SALSN|nr:hypothetical protein SASPL_149763 [Salvia splendens]
MSELADSTPRSPFSSASRMMTPLASPVKNAITSMQTYLKEVGHLTKLDPQDSWLPITESRNGNAYYAAFHTLSSGIGFQALLLPLAFTTLGWVWGIISLSLAFIWQLYTLWLLIQLHESVPGTHYSRYVRLSIAAFGGRWGKILALFPTLYLAGGTCVSLIMIGGSTLKIFFHMILAQLPNLNSIAGISLVSAITAVTYCTLTWVLSVSKARPPGVSYEPVWTKSEVGNVSSVLNALGIIAFSFRGHNLVLEIQGTMPSTAKNPSSLPMWKGIPTNGGMLSVLDKYHRNDTPRVVLGLTSLFFVINSLTSFQIYAMPAFDNMEFRYTSKNDWPCPWWLRASIRVFFGCLTLFISVALPFLKNLAGLIGGIALPVTLAYPCLMWIRIKNPQRYSSMWWLNWTLGSLGMILSILLVFGAIWTIATLGIRVHFFKPE